MATYIYGNTVRKEQVAQPVRRQTKPASKEVQRSKSHVQHISAGYVVFLAVAAVLALFVCVHYLQLQSEVSNRSDNIVSLQQQLRELQEENIAREDSIMNAMNLEEIRDIAINDLGMVYATSDQIIRYNDPVGNKVTQYSNIPESGIVSSVEGVE